MTTRYMTCAETAKLIRERLKAEFPGVKFGVRARRRGSSINIEWTDGPAQAQVDAVVGAYQSARFDGMIDMAISVSHWLLPDGTAVVARNPGTVGSMGSIERYEAERPHPDAEMVSFGASYVFTKRLYSVPLMQRALAKVAGRWGVDTSDVLIDDTSFGARVVDGWKIRVPNANNSLDVLVMRECARRSCYAPPAPKAAA